MDKHTRKGRRLGRGIEYFREVSAQLSPAPAAPDRYEDEAYAMWKRVEASNSTPDELPLADEAE
jgi:SRSO17 transposase